MKFNIFWLWVLVAVLFTSCFPSFKGGSPSSAFDIASYGRDFEVYSGETWYFKTELPWDFVDKSKWKEAFDGFNDYYTIHNGESHTIAVNWFSFKDTDAPANWKYSLYTQESTEKIEIASQSITQITYYPIRKIELTFAVTIPKDASNGNYNLLGRVVSNNDPNKTKLFGLKLKVINKPVTK